jgi:ABC-2 type transport system ATP-binding protein
VAREHYQPEHKRERHHRHAEHPEPALLPESEIPRQRDVLTAERDVLVVEGVTKSFRRGIWPVAKRIDVLKGVDLRVHSGEMVGLVGENGSGKSTIMKIIVGLLGRDGGTVDRRGKLGYCPQIPLVWDKLTVAEHFALFAKAYDMDEDQTRHSLEDLLEELQFEKYRDYRVQDLSGGTRQKLNLAISLMHDPDLLLLDEPYTGFDWETYLRFWDLSETRRRRGMGILIVSHMTTENDRLDRVVHLRDGRVESPEQPQAEQPPAEAGRAT